MARLVKVISIFIAAIVGVGVLASVALYLFFDANSFRDSISAAVKEETGRDLVIAGDIKLSVFPWVAVNVGRTELGNAAGFGEELFLSFDEAKLSVRLLPLIFQQEVKVGTASLSGLDVNLAVAANGSNNWQDLAGEGAAADTSADPSAGTAPVIDVANIAVSGANVAYVDAQAGTSFAVSNLDFDTGRIASNVPIDISAEFDLASTPGDMGGHIAIRGTATMTEGAAQLSIAGLNVSGDLRGVVSTPTEVNFDARQIEIDTVAQSINAGELDLSILGLSMSADVAPFSYAGNPEPSATLRVAEFSLKELMQVLDIEAPVTADPDALQRVSFSADAKAGSTALALTAMTLDLDDSSMTGSLSVPTTGAGSLEFDLNVDSIALDRYMAPADDSAVASSDAQSDVEIPVDLIRTLKAKGSFTIDAATLSGMQFANLELGVDASGGKLRLHPLTADFYDGSYSGDVRIDASGDVPAISANENISDVNLAAMAKAMFDQDDISGSINGSFVLSGRGQSLNAIRQDLDGNMSLELADGAWEGTDVWHQLRSARALFRQEQPPEPTLPARTEFSSVTATGVVTDGVFQNDDFLAELPFLQLTGAGMVDLNSTEVDYGLQVRVLERPEFMASATQAELDDFTKTVVPLKISGLIGSPSVRPDIEGIFRGQVEEAIEEKKDELKNDLFNRLLGGSNEPVDGAPGEETSPDGAVEPPAEEEPEDLEDKLKKELLKKIFER